MRLEKLLPWRCFVKVNSRISRIRDVPRRIANSFFGRAFLKRGNIPTRSRRLESSGKRLQAHRSPDNPARKSSHRIHVTDRSMECFRPFDELGISRMVNCSDHELRPHFSGFQQNTFELIHRSVASISSQDLPVRRLLVADTKTDTKPVKIS